jgi:hypothetical protein
MNVVKHQKRLTKVLILNQNLTKIVVKNLMVQVVILKEMIILKKLRIK